MDRIDAQPLTIQPLRKAKSDPTSRPLADIIDWDGVGEGVSLVNDCHWTTYDLKKFETSEELGAVAVGGKFVAVAAKSSDTSYACTIQVIERESGCVRELKLPEKTWLVLMSWHKDDLVLVYKTDCQGMVVVASFDADEPTQTVLTTKGQLDSKIKASEVYNDQLIIFDESETTFHWFDLELKLSVSVSGTEKLPLSATKVVANERYAVAVCMPLRRDREGDTRVIWTDFESKHGLQQRILKDVDPTLPLYLQGDDLWLGGTCLQKIELKWREGHGDGLTTVRVHGDTGIDEPARFVKMEMGFAVIDSDGELFLKTSKGWEHKASNFALPEKAVLARHASQFVAISPEDARLQVWSEMGAEPVSLTCDEFGENEFFEFAGGLCGIDPKKAQLSLLTFEPQIQHTVLGTPEVPVKPTPLSSSVEGDWRPWVVSALVLTSLVVIGSVVWQRWERIRPYLMRQS